MFCCPGKPLDSSLVKNSHASTGYARIIISSPGLHSGKVFTKHRSEHHEFNFHAWFKISFKIKTVMDTRCSRKWAGQMEKAWERTKVETLLMSKLRSANRT